MKVKRAILFFFGTVFISSILFIKNENHFGRTVVNTLNQTDLKVSGNSTNINSTVKEIEPSHTPVSIKTTNSLVTNLELNAWIPHFDFNNGLNSLKNNTAIKEIHLSGAFVVENGSASYDKAFDTNISKLNDIGRPFGINIISTNSVGTKNFLLDQQHKNSFFERIETIKTKNSNLRSINFNFEKISIENKNDFVTFIKETKEKFSIRGIKIYITFFAKTSDENNPYDYRGLTEYADHLILMTYDYTFQTNKKAGFEKANAPDFWIKDSLEYAIERVEPNKIILALPLYGYGFNKTTGKMTTSYTYSQVQRLISNEELVPKLNEEYGEMYIERSNEIIFFQNKDTLNTKMKIAEGVGIKEVFFWRLGGEGELLKQH